MEFYDLSSDGEWTGPFFRWSPAGLFDESSRDRNELHGFFLDDLAMDPKATCYIDMCENDPCDSGQTCESTWDGENAGFICNGEFSLKTISIHSQIISTAFYIEYSIIHEYPNYINP